MADRTVVVQLMGNASSLVAAATEARTALSGLASANVGAVGGQLEAVGASATRMTTESTSAFQKFSGGMTAQFALGTLAAVGMVTGIQDVIHAVSDMVSAGEKYQTALFTLQAVTGAGGDAMAAAAAEARALGKDMQIPATSATDAAVAMTELAKGGLTVQQSMDAAKGTLLLAAAASITAAQAATTQVNVLNEFNLAATEAGHVADVLANVSNHASGSMSDFSSALASGGGVAHAFGISLDDTVTTLGLFADAGIKGETAGTLLRTMLQRLATDHGPAAKALQELGVNAFDATGQFEGMRALTLQLGAAHEKLSTQAFDAAAAVAFGTRGIRGAVTLSMEAIDSFNNMGIAVGKSGGAAEIAGAKMQGFHGALENLLNQTQDVQLVVFSKIGDGLTAMINKVAEVVPAIGDIFAAVFDKIGQLFAAVKDAGVFNVLASAVSAVGAAFAGLLSFVGGTIDLFSKMPTPLKDAAIALGAVILLKGPLTALFMQMQLVGAGFGLMREQMAATVAESGLVSAGLGVVKVAASGLLAAVGGLPGLLIIGVTALGMFASKSTDATKTTTDFGDAIDANTGKIKDNAVQLEAAKLAQSGSIGMYEKLGGAAKDYTSALFQGGSAVDLVKNKIIDSGIATLQASGQYDGLTAAATALGISARDYVTQGLNATSGQLHDLANKDMPDASAAMNQFNSDTQSVTSSQQTAAQAIRAGGDAYTTAIVGTQGLTQAQTDYAAATQQAINPTDIFKASIDDLKASENSASMAAQALAIDLLGVSVTQASAARANDAAMRMVTTSARNHEDALAAVATKEQALQDLQAHGTISASALASARSAADKAQQASSKASADLAAVEEKNAKAATAAQDALVKAQQAAADGAQKAQDAVDKANAAASDGASKAQDTLDKANASAVKASTSAQDGLDKANDSATKSVASAQDALNKLQANPKSTADAISAAQAKLADAQTQAGESITAAQQKVADAASSGAESVKSAQEAKDSQAKSSAEQVKTAQEAQATQSKSSADAVAQAQQRIQDAAVSAQDAIAAAQQRIKDASESSQNAQNALSTAEAASVPSADAVAAAQRAVAAAQDAVKTAADAQTTAQEKAGASAITMSAAAESTAVAQGNLQGASQSAADTMGVQRQAFIDAATAGGMTADQASTLADKLGLIPGNVKTFFDMQGLQDAVDKAKQLGDLLMTVPQKIDAANAAIDALHVPAIQVPGSNVMGYQYMTNPFSVPSVAAPGGGHFAVGGEVTGPGTGTSDSIPAKLSNKEFVVKAKEAAKNRKLLEAINRGETIPGVQGFADGGSVGGDTITGGGATAAAASPSLAGVVMVPTPPDPLLFKKSWDAIAAAVKTSWDGTIKPTLDSLTKTSVDQGVAQTALEKTSVTPAWSKIGASVNESWASTVAPTFTALNTGTVDVGIQQVSLSKDAVAPTWAQIGNTVNGSWNSIVAPTYAALNAGTANVGAVINSTWTGTTAPTYAAMNAGTINVGATVHDTWIGTIAPSYDAMNNGVTNVGNVIQGVYNTQIVPMWTGVQGFAMAMGAFFTGISTGMTKATTETTGDIGQITKAVNDFFTLVDSKAAAVPGAAPAAAVAAPSVPGGVPALADGGIITAGTGPRADDVHIRASRGEYVVNAAAAAKNKNALDQINFGGSYADGGLVGDKISGGVHDAIVAGTHKAIDAGVNKAIASVTASSAGGAGAAGYTLNGQLTVGGDTIPLPTGPRGLFLQAVASKMGTPYVWGAAGPDTFDCSGLMSWALTQAGAGVGRLTAEGFNSGFPHLGAAQVGDLVTFDTGRIPGQAGHIGAILDVAKGLMMNTDGSGPASVASYVGRDGGPLSIVDPIGGVNTGPGASTAGAAGDPPSVGWLASVLAKLTAGGAAAGSGPGVSTSGTEQWRATVDQALGILGQPVSLDNLVLNQMRTESSGNQAAQNNTDSNAQRGTPSKGLVQVIDPTFKSFAVPPYNQNIWDPLSNILAGVNYAIHQYGSIQAGMRGVAYDNGGKLPPGYTMAYNGTGHDEWVSKTQNAAAAPTNFAPVFNQRFFIGSQEITGIVRSEIDQSFLVGAYVAQEMAGQSR